MSHRDRLFPWRMIQFLPKMPRSVVARFRNCHDAEAHLGALKRLHSMLHSEIVFAPLSDNAALDALDALAESLVLGQNAECY